MIEFGSGRGQLSFWLTQSLPESSVGEFDFLLVDRASQRHKFDNKLKDREEIRQELKKGQLRNCLQLNYTDI